MSALLPQEFADLEPFAAVWCLSTEGERYARRLELPYADLMAFYATMTPRAEAVIDYCDRFPLDSLPEDVMNLMYLMYSFVTVSFAVECWKQARVPDTGSSIIECLIQPVP